MIQIMHMAKHTELIFGLLVQEARVDSSSLSLHAAIASNMVLSFPDMRQHTCAAAEQLLTLPASQLQLQALVSQHLLLLHCICPGLLLQPQPGLQCC